MLTTARLTLSPLRARDAREMHPVLASPDLYRFIGGSPPSPEQLERRFEAQIAGSSEPGVTWLNWIVRLADDGVAVGYTQATVSCDTADIAWLVAVPWQRQRIATEAASAMCDWLRTRGVERLVAHIHPEHEASTRVAEAIGLVRTGERDADGELIWSSRHDANARPDPGLPTGPTRGTTA